MTTFEEHMLKRIEQVALKDVMYCMKILFENDCGISQEFIMALEPFFSKKIHSLSPQ